MTDEIVRLRIGITGATEAQIARLERLDQVVASLQRRGTVTVDIRGAGGANDAGRAANSAAEEIRARAELIRAENQLAALRERSRQEAERTRQAIERTEQARIRQQTAEQDRQEQQQQRIQQGWQIIGNILYRSVTRNIQQAVEELKRMDAEMVSIQKVTGATSAEMERLKDGAFDVAGDLGTTPSDYLASVTKWAQAGYKDLSAGLGELSAKTQVVGDVNEETANKFLLAVDAAYRYKGNIDALTRVLDGANEISNNYATSVDKLANGMGIVSSLAEQAGMKVEETMAAIGTITAATQESGSSAARALRALILNIQGSTEIEIDSETGERWTEDEIQRTADALGKLNVATREYRNGVMQLRNPMEVIGELAEKYQKGLVTEAQLQEVVASLGGKVRSNQLMALIQGYDTYLSMIETYKDGMGSADQELEIYLNGWEAKTNRLVAQWTQLVESFQASDLSMLVLDAGNAFLSLANTDLGNLVVQIGAVTAAVIALKTYLKGEQGTALLGALGTIPKWFSATAGAIREAMSGFGGLEAAKQGVLELGKSLYGLLGPLGLVAIGFTALYAGIRYVQGGAERAAKALAEARSGYEESSAALAGLRDELEGVRDRIAELNGKGSLLTVVEQEELDKLKEENERLERQLVIQDRINTAKRQALDLAAKNALSAGYDTNDMVDRGLFGSGGYGQQAAHVIQRLTEGQKWMDELMAQAPDRSNWTADQTAYWEEQQKALEIYRSKAGEFYAEFMENVADLQDDGLREHYEEVGDSLWACIAPAEALTQKFARLVDEMGEAERSRFDKFLAKIQKDGEVTAGEVQALLDKFPVLKQLLDMNGGSLERLAQHLTETAQASGGASQGMSNVGDSAGSSQKEIEDLANELKGCVSGMETVKDAQEELAKNGSLSADTLILLLGKYGDSIDEVILKALAGLATQEEIGDALQKAYQEDLDKYRKALLEKNMENEAFYASWLSENAGIVEKLSAQYGIDAANYRTFAELKAAVEAAEQFAIRDMLSVAVGRWKIYYEQGANDFAAAQDRMVGKAQQSTGLISGMYYGMSRTLSRLFGGIVGAVSGVVNDFKAQWDQKDQADYWEGIMDSISPPSLGGGDISSGKSGGSSKNWYEQQIEDLKKLEEVTKRTNQVLERSDQDTAQQRIQNLRDLQVSALSMQKEFIARGLAETADEVSQLKLIYSGLEDDIRSIYASMTKDLTSRHDRIKWEFDLKGNEPRTMEQIAADDEKMVEQYRQMQKEVHDLANYYRSQDLRENDELIQDLQDKWWEYEKAIRSIYDDLTDAFNAYIDESSHKIEELGRTTGNVGKQIEVYAQRIKKAQETIAALEAHNIGGANNGKIHDLESQIWGDKDSIRDLQEGLWKELEDAFDDIFDGVKEDIEDIQDQMDEIDEILEKYDKELEGILEPINEALERLNEQLEAEKERLESQTGPLEERKGALEDKINGHYELAPDGSIGAYIPGLDDEIDEIQEQLDKANEELDRVNDEWNAQKEREEEALALQKKQLAVEEAQKAVQDALLALQTARNERNIYTLKDGVWAWRADEEAVAKAEKALAEAEKAKEEAEKELQDYKEEQAHKQIVKRLEEQIRALEEQKKLLDKQKDLINKQIDAIDKQISAFEKESKARQDYIQDLIDQKEKEKETWEDHYEQLKKQYSQQLEMLEEEKKAAEKRYDQWMDTWEDIQKSIETPARDISEILNDIAKYGTPAMAGQVDRVTDLLRDLGYVLDDITSGGGYDPDGGGEDGGDEMSRREIIDQMLANAKAYQNASAEERERLFEENQQLGDRIGAVWDPNTYRWDIFDYSGGQVTVKPGAYDDDWSGYSGYSLRPMQAPRLEELQNDGWEQTKRQNGYLTSDDYVSARPPIAPGYDPATNTYTDDHSITINGMRLGSDMMQRPISDVFQLVSLNMGT